MEDLKRAGESRRFKLFERVALRKLDMLGAAVSLDALRVPPENRLEALRGDRKGPHSIRINDRWRICFVPMGISQYRLATDIRVPAPRICAIRKGRRAITADTALRLGRYFGTGPEFWANLQTHYDPYAAVAREKRDIAAIAPLPAFA